MVRKINKKVVPTLKGLKLDEAKDKLKKAGIEEYSIKKKFDLFTKSGYVIKSKPSEENELKENLIVYVSERRILLIILLFLLCILITLFLNGTVSIVFETTAPIIKSDAHEWSKNSLISVEKDATMKNKLSHYEYCVSKGKSTLNCNWIKTTTKNTQISLSGKWYVYFRGVDEKNQKSKTSNREYALVDNDAPIIEKLSETVTFNSIKLDVKATDLHSGLDKLYYSIDDGSLVEGKNEFTFENLLSNHEYKITIKAVDKLGNESIYTKTIKTKEEVQTTTKANKTTKKTSTKKPNEDKPSIDLIDLPNIINYKDSYKLPSHYSFGNSTGVVECYSDDQLVTNTDELTTGEHKITCTATNKEGASATVSKTIYVKLNEAPQEDLDGWIWLNLYYPENSTNWEWKLIREDEVMSDNDLLWNPYTGPILVRVEDVENIYIRYTLNENEVIESKSGYFIDITADKNPVKNGEEANITLNYSKNVDKVEYSVNNGKWESYENVFQVGANNLITARITYHENVYDADGNILITKTKTKQVEAYISSTEDFYDAGSLDIKIYPSSKYVNNNRKVTITIDYDSDATSKYYRINDGEWTLYNGPFQVSKESIIYATATGKRTIYQDGTLRNYNVSGNTSLYLAEKYYEVYINSDKESMDSSETTSVNIDTSYSADLIEYSLNDGEFKKYEEKFNVPVNTLITARATFTLDNGETLVVYSKKYISEDKSSLKVRINPSRNFVGGNESATINITTNFKAESIEYSLDNGKTYTKYISPFKVSPETLIIARSTKKNTDGSIQTTYDSRYIYRDDLGLEIVPSAFEAFTNTSVSAIISTYYKVDKLEYSYDGKNYTEYAGKVSILAGKTLYARATYNGMVSYTSTYIKEIKKVTGLDGPTISTNPSTSLVSKTNVTITPKEEADKIYYSIDYGTWHEYTEPFTIDKNVVISAYYIRKSDGQTSRTSYYYIQNIYEGKTPYVRIDATPSTYLSDTLDEVDVQISAKDYDTLKYSLDGYIYQDYIDPIKINTSTTIYAKATNKYGETIEKLRIRTKTPSKKIDNLLVSIITDPNEVTANGLVNKVNVQLLYGKEVEKAYYKIGSKDEWKEYTGSFEVTKNTTIYAYVLSSTGSGTNEKQISFLTDSIAEPIIKHNPLELNDSVTVDITYSENATIKKYKIDNGKWLDYTEPFELTENATITAYNEDIFGNNSQSTHTIKNITYIPKYTVLDEGDYYLIRLNYPSDSLESEREYKWKSNGVWKTYDKHGILLIKPEAAKNILTSDGVKIIDDQGQEVLITDHYYILDSNTPNLKEDLFMRWGSKKIEAPIIISSTEEITKSLDVAISYNKALVNKYYRIIDETKDTGWLEYKGKINITSNCVIYAKGTDRLGSSSDISSLEILNIDNESPIINVSGDLVNQKRIVNLFVSVTDDQVVQTIRYAKGKKDLNYFAKSGTNISNNSNLKITENGIYTIYAIDSVGNETIKEIEVTNKVDKVSLYINVLTTDFSDSVDVEIDYGESIVKKYRIGSSEIMNYNGTITLKSVDVVKYMNEDYSLTIFAYGKDYDGSDIETQETIYNLDLRVPKQPTIESTDGYPVLDDSGISLNYIHKLKFDDTVDGVENFYSLDNGSTWIEYTKPFEFTYGTILTKSVKKLSGLTVTSEIPVSLPENAIKSVMYDDDLTSGEEIEKGSYQRFNISPLAYGKTIRIFNGETVATNAKIELYDKDDALLEKDNLIKNVNQLTIPKEASYAKIVAGDKNLLINEIKITKIDEEVNYPVITVNDTNWSKDKTITIKYFGKNKNEYSLDEGATWISYSQPFVITKNTSIIARSTKDDVTLASSVLKINKIKQDATLTLTDEFVETGYAVKQGNVGYTYDGDAEIEVISKDQDIATVKVENGRITIIPGKILGQTTIEVRACGGTKYNDIIKTITVENKNYPILEVENYQTSGKTIHIKYRYVGDGKVSSISINNEELADLTYDLENETIEVTAKTIGSVKLTIKAESGINNSSAELVKTINFGTKVDSNSTAFQSALTTWGTIGTATDANWYGSFDEGYESNGIYTIIETVNTNNFTGYYFREKDASGNYVTPKYKDIALEFEMTSTNSDDDALGVMIRFNPSTTKNYWSGYLLFLDKHDSNSGIGNGAYNGLWRANNKQFSANGLTSSTKLKINSKIVWSRNKWQRYRVEASDNKITVWRWELNSQNEYPITSTYKIFEYTDTSSKKITAGSYGFWCYSQAYTQFRNFTAMTISNEMVITLE